jgi:hypothetical protein
VAVYEDERPGRAKATEVDRRETGSPGRNEIALRWIDLWELIEDLLRVRRTLQFEFVALDHRDRTDSGQIRTRDA